MYLFLNKHLSYEYNKKITALYVSNSTFIIPIKTRIGF